MPKEKATSFGDLERIENHLALAFWNVFGSKALNIKLDSFFKVHLGFFDRLSLTHNPQLNAMSNIPFFFFSDNSRKFHR